MLIYIYNDMMFMHGMFFEKLSTCKCIRLNSWKLSNELPCTFEYFLKNILTYKNIRLNSWKVSNEHLCTVLLQISCLRNNL